ncbi:putative Holliday junction resolvase [Anaeroplasma bactoclasticum]|jgi:putative Holliday junction resolvase|uniref:Putative pre-16S rRNA nuclease n=1 Tax=Anaeroplasma bactoclasticum TaxID=2088 RepID=A0A397S0I4_9MOLU|nr:Holliday junction resolvase RuvX [Anaeroplasma bactoclasticum]RIA78306.1 putative Holliday junction resolvase [Anaeroplasma bactoclasticum]
MKYIGLDLGSRTLGVAISDEMGILARAYDTFRFRDDDYDKAISYTIDVCKKENVNTIVLGLPKHMNGDEGIRAQISFDFKAKIEELSNIKVILMDERLTTVIVDKAMIEANVRRKDRHQKKDEMAAVVILQNYLDKKSF